MGKQLISTDGFTATYLHDAQDGKRVIETVSNVEAIVERAKARHNQGMTRTGMGDRCVADIPIPVLDAWARSIGKTFGDVMNDQALMTRFLRDPAHSYFIIDKASV